MIVSLKGILKDVAPPFIVVETTGGVGYELQVSMSALAGLPAPGKEMEIVTHLVVREDAQLLYGFKDAREKADFLELIKISGIGAKIAMSVISVLNHEDLAAAVARDDVKALSSVPGIGKKTAERMLLELKGKITSDGLADAGSTPIPGAHAPVHGGSRGEIIQALIALGYKEKEAFLLVKELPEDVEVTEGIRLALSAVRTKTL